MSLFVLFDWIVMFYACEKINCSLYIHMYHKHKLILCIDFPSKPIFLVRSDSHTHAGVTISYRLICKGLERQSHAALEMTSFEVCIDANVHRAYTS